MTQHIHCKLEGGTALFNIYDDKLKKNLFRSWIPEVQFKHTYLKLQLNSYARKLVRPLNDSMHRAQLYGGCSVPNPESRCGAI